MDDAQLICIRNNAEWCDLVCRSHSVPGTYERSLWIQPGVGPEFYPNVITLARNDRQEQTERISDLLALRSSISVKDSFSALDLSTVGMRRVFDAEWVWMDPANSRHSFNMSERWSRIESVAELAYWQTAWRGAAPGSPVFLPALLENSSIVFLAAWSGAAIVAGCVLNRDANNVVGLSNLFSPVAGRDRYFTAAINHASQFARGAPLVGYQSGEDLIRMKSSGFRSVGVLTVWA